MCMESGSHLSMLGQGGKKQTNKPKWPKEEDEDLISGIAVVPYCHNESNRLGQLLSRRNIKTTFCPLIKQ